MLIFSEHNTFAYIPRNCHSSSHIFVAGATEARWFFTGPAPGGRGKSSTRQKGSFSRLSHLFLIPWYLLLISLPYVSSHCLLTFIFNKFRQPKRIILKTFSPLFHHLFKILLKTSRDKNNFFHYLTSFPSFSSLFHLFLIIRPFPPIRCPAFFWAPQLTCTCSVVCSLHAKCIWPNYAASNWIFLSDPSPIIVYPCQ